MTNPDHLTSIAELRVVTSNAERLAFFYTAIGFHTEAAGAVAPDEMRLFGLSGGATHITVALGRERIVLEQFDRPGRPYPGGGEVADLHFQHFAIVTSDASAAWELARANGAVPISTNGPVTLPRSSGGVTAIKFRDPEGHPLEFLQFPPDAESRWTGSGILGIDHTAITTSDLISSRAFYEGLGLRTGKPTLNRGPEQAALDGVEKPVVDVVPMHPREGGPNLELLAYRRPSGRSVPREVNDIASTRIVWRANGEGLIRDPDGHLHQLSR